MPQSLPTVGFIGAGRIASALAPALARAGYVVAAIASAHRASAEQLSAAVSAARATDPQDVVDTCEIVFLTVPDAAIAPAAHALTWRPGKAAVHCSGALGLESFAAVVRSGGLAGCLHPLQSFPMRETGAVSLADVWCGVEGPPPLAAHLEAMVQAFGGQAFSLEGIDRALYHASAVFANNFVVALASAAGRLWALAGLPPEAARPALAHLLFAGATNAATMELAGALTGPLKRGDVATVERHLAALATEPALAGLYRSLSLELLELSLAHSPDTAARLRALLED